MTNTFIRSQSSVVNHTQFQTKRAKTKAMQKRYPSGRHIPIWLLSYQIPIKLFIEAMDKYVNYEDYQGKESMYDNNEVMFISLVCKRKLN